MKYWNLVVLVILVTIIAGCAAPEPTLSPPKPEVWLDDCLECCAVSYEIGSTWHGECARLCNNYYKEVLH